MFHWGKGVLALIFQSLAKKKKPKKTNKQGTQDRKQQTVERMENHKPRRRRKEECGRRNNRQSQSNSVKWSNWIIWHCYSDFFFWQKKSQSNSAKWPKYGRNMFSLSSSKLGRARSDLQQGLSERSAPILRAAHFFFCFWSLLCEDGRDPPPKKNKKNDALRFASFCELLRRPLKFGILKEWPHSQPATVTPRQSQSHRWWHFSGKSATTSSAGSFTVASTT